MVTVSCIITFHQEGLLAYTTLSTIARARDYAELKGLHVEFVITLDNTNTSTEETVRRHFGIRSGDVIEKVNYGDPGLSRNYATKIASGDYLVCFDGDDYYPSNYIVATISEALKDNDAVVCPEYLFSFGDELHYTRLGGAKNGPNNSFALFSEHHYCTRVAAHKSVFARVPFAPCAPGYGYEDWHWNMEARAVGLRHRIAEGVVLFYRRRAFRSVSRAHLQENAIVPKSSFFDLLPDPVDSGPAAPPAIPSVAFPWKKCLAACASMVFRLMPRKTGSRAYAVVRDWKGFAKKVVFHCLSRLPESVENRLYPLLAGFWHARTRQSNAFSPNIYDALLDVAHIDGLLHPDHLPSAPFIAFPGDEMPGRAYAAMWRALPHHAYDIVYTAPHVNIGGADLMTLNYMRASCAAGKRVLCITTDGNPNALDVFPSGADVLNFGEYAFFLREEQRVDVLTRLLVQLTPGLIHIVNDTMGLQSVVRHGKALEQSGKIFVSIFADAQDHNDIFYGKGTGFLREIYPYITRVITDNAVTALDWAGRFGFPDHFLRPVYSCISASGRNFVSPSTRDHILWAGRLDNEKRLDIAYEIAKRLPDMKFDFYGKAVLDRKCQALKLLKALPNVALHGGYSNFGVLDTTRYFAFLYTTQNDGLPNVLLEAVAAGLPVIAPDRGGIRDFVTNQTGWLIESYRNIDAYVAALEEARGNSEEAAIRWSRAYALLTARHNTESFARTLMDVYNSGDTYRDFIR